MPKLDFEVDIQQQILGALIYSKTFLRTFRNLIMPEDFLSDEHWTLCSIVYDFYDKYNTEPNILIKLELSDYFKVKSISVDRQALLLLALQNCTMLDIEKEEALATRVLEFVKHQRTRKILEEFIPDFNRGEYRIDDLLYNISQIQELTQNLCPELAVDYIATVSQRIAERHLRQKVSPPCATLIPPLDARFLGIYRGQLGTLLAPSGIGKTTALIYLGKAAIFQEFNVLHIVLERGRKVTEIGYVRAFIGVSEQNLHDIESDNRLTYALRQIPSKRLMIAELHEGSTVRDIRQLIQGLRERENFIPDMLIVDYGELLDAGVKFSRSRKP